MHYKIRPEPIPFTKAAFDQMKRDVVRLERELKEAKERLAIARAMGDLSENGAYKYAKFEISSINRQLRRLRPLLRDGFVATAQQASVISFGSQVELESNGKKLTFLIVSEHESNPLEGKLSLKSPLGCLIDGKRAGDEVTLVRENGHTIYKIISVN